MRADSGYRGNEIASTNEIVIMPDPANGRKERKRNVSLQRARIEGALDLDESVMECKQVRLAPSTHMKKE